MTSFPAEKISHSIQHGGTMLVVIEHRALFLESFVSHLKNNSNVWDIEGFPSVASWQAASRTVPTPSLVLIAAAHRSMMQMNADLKTLAAISPGVPVVLLSEMEDYNQVAEAMQRGLRGFIPASSSVNLAQSALALVLAGGCFIPSDIVWKRSAQRLADEHGPGSVRLTEREAAVLDAVQIGKPNKIIAYELDICINTVKVHVRNIMKKLQAKNRTELAYLVNTQRIGPRALQPGGFV